MKTQQSHVSTTAETSLLCNIYITKIYRVIEFTHYSDFLILYINTRNLKINALRNNTPTYNYLKDRLLFSLDIFFFKKRSFFWGGGVHF